MNISTTEPLARAVRFDDGRLVVDLVDGRQVRVQVAFYPTLDRASATQRNRWRLIGGGEGIHWEALDLDLSTQGVLDGIPERVTTRRVQSGPARTRRASLGSSRSVDGPVVNAGGLKVAAKKRGASPAGKVKKKKR